MGQELINLIFTILSYGFMFVLCGLCVVGVLLLTGRFPKVHPIIWIFGILVVLAPLLFMIKPSPPLIAFATHTPTKTLAAISPPPPLPSLLPSPIPSPTARAVATLPDSIITPSPTPKFTPTAEPSPTPTITPRPPCADIPIRIISPISGQTFSRYDSIKIIGAYFNPNVKEKRPYIGVRVEASNVYWAKTDDKPWEILVPTIAQGEVTRDELLASWTPSLSKSLFTDGTVSLPNGWYYLRLIVFEGNEYGQPTGQFQKMEQKCWVTIYITGSN